MEINYNLEMNGITKPLDLRAQKEALTVGQSNFLYIKDTLLKSS
jgi:hypothetical protein